MSKFKIGAAFIATALAGAACVGPAISEAPPLDSEGIAAELRGIGVGEDMVRTLIRQIEANDTGGVYVAIAHDGSAWGLQHCYDSHTNRDECRRAARRWCERYTEARCSVAVERRSTTAPYRFVWPAGPVR